ncbi:hypothetical protein O0L34_g552 [Tuta absoluta]|nr:hypothetical protein O0L34_g552 [Tuta absoluta]
MPRVPLAPPRRPHLSLAPARTRVYLYVLSFGGFKPNPPRPQSALRRPRARAVAASRSPPPPPLSTDSPAKLCPKSTGARTPRINSHRRPIPQRRDSRESNHDRATHLTHQHAPTLPHDTRK